jgi:aminoglycoside phosphotransferase (APT) family kinase protein
MRAGMAAIDIVDTPREAAEQELPPLIVREPLAAFLDEQGLGSGEVEAERIGEGHSNLTFLVRRGGERFVVRRPPRPPYHPNAHDVLREARVLGALNDADTRTPRVIAVCDDESVLGVPFYVMPYLEGTVITWELPQDLDTPEERRRIADELIDTLAEIHAVDWRAAGLEGFGKPTGYLDRQLRRFSGLWEHNKTRDVPALEETTSWLAGHKPESPESTIVHGDYRLGNTMFAPGAPARLVAVFDWELSTIGDPLADVGYLTATWAQRDDPDQLMFKLSEVTKKEGFPTRDELVARYEERTGRSMSDLRWYQTLALWKSAVFLEGSYKRFNEGTTDDQWFAFLEDGVPQIAEAALEVARSRAPAA